MLLTPFVFMASENISIQILRLKNQLSKKVDSVYLSEQINFTTDQPHLVIIGFGVNGSNLATAANTSQIPYVIVDFDARLVKNKYQEGYPIIFGDASQESILEAVDIHNAKVVVVAISNIKETKHIVELVRVLNKQAYIIVRTRYIKEMGELFALGADDVIPEEYETSLQIFTKVLGQFDTAESEINEIAERVRNDHYQLFLQYKNVKVDS
jgi:CPA2 family monovalent cation:H+ antiporter-2